MYNSTIYKLPLILSLFLLLSCENEKGSTDVVDYSVFSDFYLDNQSNYPLTVEYFTYDPQFTTEPPLPISVQIEPGQTEFLLNFGDLASDIVYAPTPQSTFFDLDIYTVFGQDVFYTDENKLNDEEWNKALDGRLTIFTLTIIDNDFVF